MIFFNWNYSADPKTMWFTYRHYTDKSSYTPIEYDDIKFNWEPENKSSFI